MDFTSGQFDFPTTSGSGPQSLSLSFSFEHRISKASAVLLGYEAFFMNGDHNFGRLIVNLDTQIVNDPAAGQQVVVTATFGLRDFSGDWDDPYTGRVQFVLITEPQHRMPPVAVAGVVGMGMP